MISDSSKISEYERTAKFKELKDIKSTDACIFWIIVPDEIDRLLVMKCICVIKVVYKGIRPSVV